jgi:hypothetical protein
MTQPVDASTDAAHQMWVRFSELEPHFRDMTRIAAALDKFHVERIASSSELTDDQYYLVTETLIDRLQSARR